MGEAQAKHAGGRPSLYDPEIAARLCERLALGEPLVKIAPDLGIGISTVYRWQLDNPEFRQAYARAREDQADTFADEIVQIADDASNDTMVDEDGHEYTSHENIQRSKLRVDTRKWVAAKLKPKVYSDRQQVEHSGAIETTTTDPNELVARLVTMGTQYPTLNPVIRKLAQDILDQLPEIKS